MALIQDILLGALGVLGGQLFFIFTWQSARVFLDTFGGISNNLTGLADGYDCLGFCNEAFWKNS